MNNKACKKSGQRPCPLLLLMAVLIAAMLFAGCGKKAETETGAAGQEVQSQAIEDTIEYNGKTYRYNKDLTNILFLGIDKTDPINGTYTEGAGQSDCIMILSLNEKEKTGRILQITRNAMTRLDVYDETGRSVNEVDGPICLQYAYGNGGTNSCWAARKTVGELLYDLRIDGYFAMDMAGIAEINDALGGVEVEMKQDYTWINDAFIEGETVHLEGKMAEEFVRTRDLSKFNSVSDRMDRQTDYITSLIDQMHRSGGQKLYDILNPYMDTYLLTDLSAEQMNALTKYTYLTDQIESVPGQMEEGKLYEEYHVDNAALQDLVIGMFYEEVSSNQ